MEKDLYGELSYAFGALALNFSKNEGITRRLLETHNMRMFRTKVVTANSNASLNTALANMMANRATRAAIGFGERHIILVKAGVYTVDPMMLTRMFAGIIIGDMSGPKPTIQINSQHSSTLRYNNIFVNIHFKIT